MFFGPTIPSGPKGLSRLKGIETIAVTLKKRAAIVKSERTFPFEGNWNTNTLSRTTTFVWSERTFPFEGNWNPFELFWVMCTDLRPKGLSRLKGIETFQSANDPNVKVAVGPKGLSRLKGIETVAALFTCWLFLKTSERTFPFEGNWNSSKLLMCSITALSPKGLSRLKGIETDYDMLRW